MKVPGIEEIDETYLGGFVQAIQARTDGVTWNDDIRRAGLLAVFETHVKGLLLNAFLAGANYEADFSAPRRGGKGPDRYVESILALIAKGERHD